MVALSMVARIGCAPGHRPDGGRLALGSARQWVARTPAALASVGDRVEAEGLPALRPLSVAVRRPQLRSVWRTRSSCGEVPCVHGWHVPREAVRLEPARPTHAVPLGRSRPARLFRDALPGCPIHGGCNRPHRFCRFEWPGTLSRRLNRPYRVTSVAAVRVPGAGQAGCASTWQCHWRTNSDCSIARRGAPCVGDSAAGARGGRGGTWGGR